MAAVDSAYCPLCDTVVPLTGTITKVFISHTVSRGVVSWECPNTGKSYTSADTVGTIVGGS